MAKRPAGYVRRPAARRLAFRRESLKWRSIGRPRFRGALFIARITVASGEPDFSRNRRPYDEQEKTRSMQIIARDNNIDQAIREHTKKLPPEWVYRNIDMRRPHEKSRETRAGEPARTGGSRQLRRRRGRRR